MTDKGARGPPAKQVVAGIVDMAWWFRHIHSTTGDAKRSIIKENGCGLGYNPPRLIFIEAVI